MIRAVLAVAFAAVPRAHAQDRKSPRPEVWVFDRIENIGGLPTTVLGHPRVIDTPMGKAVEFNGINDALFVGEHPLTGAETFTFEAIFRPDPGGAPEQRWFHLSEQDPATGNDTDNRLLFETRLIGDNWCLDAFVNTPAGNKRFSIAVFSTRWALGITSPWSMRLWNSAAMSMVGSKKKLRSPFYLRVTAALP